MSELSEWLLGRLTEDEAVARAAAEDTMWGGDNGHWAFIGYDYEGCWPTSATDLASDANGYDPDMTWTNHAARHDPARVLATVKAHRAIVELAEEATSMDLSLDQEFRVGSRDEAAQPYLGDLILRALASIYADAPGFREEWLQQWLQ